MPDSVDQVMEVLDDHRWKSMGVESVECQCGAIVFAAKEDPTLTLFPADRVFRQHIANEIIEKLNRDA